MAVGITEEALRTSRYVGLESGVLSVPCQLHERGAQIHLCLVTWGKKVGSPALKSHVMCRKGGGRCVGDWVISFFWLTVAMPNVGPYTS